MCAPATLAERLDTLIDLTMLLLLKLLCCGTLLLIVLLA